MDLITSAPEFSAPAYYAIIPASVRYDPRLRPNAKLLYGEISALASAGGFCFANNRYFADLYGLGNKTISELIQSLARSGHIIVEIIRDEKGAVDKRKIWLSAHAMLSQTPIPKNRDTSPEKSGDPIPKNREDNNTSINNNTPIVPKIAPKVITDLLADYADGDAKLLEALLGFAEMRSKIRAAITTERAVTLLTNRLDKLSGGSARLKIEMLEEATLKNWKTVYAPKDGAVPAAPSRVIETEVSKEWD